DAAGRDRGDKSRQAKSPGGAHESRKHGNILPGDPLQNKVSPALSSTPASAKEPGYTPYNSLATSATMTSAWQAHAVLHPSLHPRPVRHAPSGAGIQRANR